MLSKVCWKDTNLVAFNAAELSTRYPMMIKTAFNRVTIFVDGDMDLDKFILIFQPDY